MKEHHLELLFFVITFSPISCLIQCPNGVERFSAYPTIDTTDPAYYFECSTARYAHLKRCKSNKVFDRTTEMCQIDSLNPANIAKLRSKRDTSQESDFEVLKLEPSLGRPLKLGTLYYGKDETFNLQENLWNDKNLEVNSTKIDKPSSKTQLAITQTTKEVATLFGYDIVFNVKFLGVCFLCGGVNSLTTKKTTNKFSRVTYSYEAVTTSETISQDLRTKLDHPDICIDIIGRTNGPTHVVTTIIRFENIATVMSLYVVQGYLKIVS